MANIEEMSRSGDLAGLVAALGTENWVRREAAADALGRLGDAGAVGPLQAAAQDPDERVRRAVKKALMRIQMGGDGLLKAAVWRLNLIYLQTPRGFDDTRYLPFGDPELGMPVSLPPETDLEVELRIIGELLRDQGGVDLMRQAWRAFTDYDKRFQGRLSHNLWDMWRGIW